MTWRDLYAFPQLDEAPVETWHWPACVRGQLALGTQGSGALRLL